MKFYYNGRLVRTSKNHVYTHAVIDMSDGECMGCRSNMKSAESLISSEIAFNKKIMADKERAVKALKAGMSYYIAKDRGHSYRVSLNNDYQTIEYYEKGIAGCQRAIRSIEANWKVVELEAK